MAVTVAAAKRYLCRYTVEDIKNISIIREEPSLPAEDGVLVIKTAMPELLHGFQPDHAVEVDLLIIRVWTTNDDEAFQTAEVRTRLLSA